MKDKETRPAAGQTEQSGRAILPEPTVRRLPWYLAYVSMLRWENMEYVSSTQISKELNVDASQIAKDLSFLNLKGKTRIGYEVSRLEHELQDFLGFKKKHNAVLVGTGSLGAALLADSGLHNYGLNIVAAFDINPSLIGSTISGVTVYHSARLEEMRPALKAEIGIVTVPVEYAQNVADQMVSAGIKAIWNFTPARLHVPPGIVIENTSIYAHLAVMYNRMGK